MASVTANMRLCDKKTKVTVTPKDDGTFDVLIDTDCDHVSEYAKGMQNITMDDIIDMSKSKVMSFESTIMMTPTCLVPKAVLYAAWLEIGMISPTRAKDAGENSISFE
jgi:hypothetical protein